MRSTDELRRCIDCIHFGEIRETGGIVRGYACLAPITTEPPKDGVTPARNRFVYTASPRSECELWTNKRVSDLMFDERPSAITKGRCANCAHWRKLSEEDRAQFRFAIRLSDQIGRRVDIGHCVASGERTGPTADGDWCESWGQAMPDAR